MTLDEDAVQDALAPGFPVALGLLPPQRAVCMNIDHGLRDDRCHVATCQVPRFGEGCFFSLTLHGAEQHIREERSWAPPGHRTREPREVP
jgi:hypothetical protein